MRARPLLAALAAAALLLSGCGSGTAPAEDVPALATALDDVDAAVVSGDDTAVRDAVDALTEVTTRARDAGDLEESTSPTEDETPEPPSPTPTPTPAPPEPTSGDEGDDEDDDDKGKSEEKGEGKGEDKGEDKGNDKKDKGD